MQQRGTGGHLDSPGLDIAPVRDVADMDHEGNVHDRVAGHAGLEALWVPSQKISGQKATMAATADCYMLRLHMPCKVIQFLVFCL